MFKGEKEAVAGIMILRNRLRKVFDKVVNNPKAVNEGGVVGVVNVVKSLVVISVGERRGGGRGVGRGVGHGHEHGHGHGGSGKRG